MIFKKTLYGEPVISINDIAEIHNVNAGDISKYLENAIETFKNGEDYFAVDSNNVYKIKTFDLIGNFSLMSILKPVGIVEEHPGVVYIAKDPNGSGVKIGRTQNKVETRISQLNTGRADNITEYVSYECRDVVLAETKSHSALSEFRKSGEWFSVDMKMAESVVKSVVEEVNELISEKKRNENVVYPQIMLFTRLGYSKIFFGCIDYNDSSRAVAKDTLKRYFEVEFPFIKRITIPREEFLAHKEEWFDVEASGDSLEIDEGCEEITIDVSWSLSEVFDQILQSLPNE